MHFPPNVGVSKIQGDGLVKSKKIGPYDPAQMPKSYQFPGLVGRICAAAVSALVLREISSPRRQVPFRPFAGSSASRGSAPCPSQQRLPSGPSRSHQPTSRCVPSWCRPRWYRLCWPGTARRPCASGRRSSPSCCCSSRRSRRCSAGPP